MKKLHFLNAVGLWAALSLAAQGQMSTFPAPPSLPSPSSSAGSTPSSPSGSNGSSTGTTTGSSTSSKAPALTAANLNSMDALDDKTALQDGDTISFRVIEDRDEAVQRVVTDTGDVDFPYIGPVKVEGETCRQAADKVKKLLEVNYYKQATVIIGLDLIVGQDNDTKPKDYAWVMGEVRQVGPLELLKQQPMTVSQLIMRAGGFGDFADQRKVKVIHRTDGQQGAVDINSKNSQVIDVKSILDGKPGTDPVVKPGDYIIVPKKFINY